MNFSQEQRAGKVGHNGFRRLQPPGGNSNWSPYTQFEDTPSARGNRPTNFSRNARGGQHNGQQDYHSMSEARVQGQHHAQQQQQYVSQTVPLNSEYNFQGGNGGDGAGDGYGNAPMNSKTEYAGMMEKRGGSGRSAGGGSSQFNPFAHAGQGHYDNPYDRSKNPAHAQTRTQVGQQSDLNFLPGGGSGASSGVAVGTVSSARGGSGGWRQSASRENNIFSSAATTQVNARAAAPTWQSSSSRTTSNHNSNSRYPMPQQQQQQQQQPPPQQEYHHPHSQQQQYGQYPMSVADRTYQQMNEAFQASPARSAPPQQQQQAQQGNYGNGVAVAEAPPRVRQAPKVFISASAGARRGRQGAGGSRENSSQFGNGGRVMGGGVSTGGYQPSMMGQGRGAGRPAAEPNPAPARQLPPSSGAGQGGNMNRRDEVWEQKRQQRLMRKQQQSGQQQQQGNFSGGRW